MLSDIRKNNDSSSLYHLIKIYSQAIDILNLEKVESKQSHLLDALYSTFLISPLDDEDCDADESVFKHYKCNYNIMGVNSLLSLDVLNLQQMMDAV